MQVSPWQRSLANSLCGFSMIAVEHFMFQRNFLIKIVDDFECLFDFSRLCSGLAHCPPISKTSCCWFAPGYRDWAGPVILHVICDTQIQARANGKGRREVRKRKKERKKQKTKDVVPKRYREMDGER